MVFKLRLQNNSLRVFQTIGGTGLFLLLIVAFLSLLMGCAKQKSVNNKKENTVRIEAISHIPLFQNVAVPFSSTIEQYHADTDGTDKSKTVYLYFPAQSVDFIVLYYKNTMEQYGWILSNEFDGSDVVILHFFSVSRTCLVCIYKHSPLQVNTKKIMLCAAWTNT